MNFMFEWQELYLTSERREQRRYSSCHSNIKFISSRHRVISSIYVLAELQRAKRASEAPWVRKIGNPASRENVVMTSAYERPHVRPYRLGGRRRGVSRYSSRSPIRETKERHLFRKVRKTLISICHVNKRSERLI